MGSKKPAVPLPRTMAGRDWEREQQRQRVVGKTPFLLQQESKENVQSLRIEGTLLMTD